MSLPDSFITLLFLSAMLLFMVFMCRDLTRHKRTINIMRARSFSPVFPSVSKKVDQPSKDAKAETNEKDQRGTKH